MRSNLPSIRIEPIGGDEGGAGPDAEALAHWLRGKASAPRLISVPSPRARGSSASRVTRMQPVPVPRSSSLSGLSRKPFRATRVERRLDQGLGIGARVERMRIEVEFAAVELAGAGDPRHGLAFEPPRDGGVERAPASGRSGSPASRDIGLVASGRRRGRAAAAHRARASRSPPGARRKPPRRRPGSGSRPQAWPSSCMDASWVV